MLLCRCTWVYWYAYKQERSENSMSCDGIAHIAAKCRCEMKLQNVLKLATDKHLLF